MHCMALWLIPLHSALPALQAYLSRQVTQPLDPAEKQVVADLLEQCVRTGELLVTYVVLVSGRPYHN